MSVKDHIKGIVTFQYARKGALWYKTEKDFMFPVPFDDMGEAQFLPTDKAMLFMRWIRKELAVQDKP